MTSPEKKALLFLSLVAALGFGTRAARARDPGPGADIASRRALATQIAASESAARASKRPGRSRKSFSLGATAREGAGQTPTRDGVRGGGGAVDLDVADIASIEALPGIGPALAARIVTDREACGPFGSLEGFRRVPGVGAGLARRLESRVRFSGLPRAPNSVLEPACAPRARGRKAL